MTAVTPAPVGMARRPTAGAPCADVLGMHILARLARALRVDDDALADHRDRIAMILSGLSAVLLLPFSVNHLLSGREALGLLVLSTQVMMAANTWTLRRGRPAPVPFWIMTLGFMVAVCSAIHLQGLHGVFWAYPAVFVSYFTLQRRLALALSVALLAFGTALTLHVLGLAVAVRFFATLALTLVMINVVLNVLSDLQRALVQQTLTDPLTGAYNRRHMNAQLARLAHSQSSVLNMNALLAIDIDHFKAINDRHGHAVGDQVLVRCVGTLSERKRQADMLFRTGGEEFVLLLPRTSQADAVAVAQALCQLVAQAPLLAGQPVTVSIGVGVQQPGHGADAWLRAADAALYRAKQNGRNRVEVCA